jgi:hypothetical protein
MDHDKDVEATLKALHSALAKDLLARVTSGQATAADLSVVRAFLKDNNIDGVPKKGSDLAELARHVPFTGADEADFHH